MDSIISTFHIDWKIIIAQAINFGVVFVVLYIFALKPLSKLMAERSEKIAKGVDDAKMHASLLEKTKAEYDEALAKAKMEANKILVERKKEAETEKALMLETAKKEVATLVENGKKTLQAEKEKMVSEAKKEIAILVVNTAEKLLGSQVDGAFNQRAVKELSNL